MSQVVRENRKKSDFKILIDAKYLYHHTIKITSNPKNFDISQGIGRTILLESIIKDAESIYIEASCANEIRVVNGDSVAYKIRREHQARAIDACVALKKRISLSKSAFHLSSKQVVFWNKLVEDLRALLVAWKAKDAERYKDCR